MSGNSGILIELQLRRRRCHLSLTDCTGDDDRKLGRGLSGPMTANAMSEPNKTQGKPDAHSLSRTSVPIEWFGMRARVAVVVSVCALVLGFVIWHLRSGKPGNQAAAPATSSNAITEP